MTSALPAALAGISLLPVLTFAVPVGALENPCALDPAFGGDGIAEVAAPAAAAIATAAMRDSQGRWIVAGQVTQATSETDVFVALPTRRCC